MNDNEGQLKQNTSLEMILLLFDSLGGIISLKLYWQKVRSCYKLLIDVNIPVKVDIKIRSIATLHSWPEAKPHNSRRRMRGATSSGDCEVGIPVTLVLWYGDINNLSRWPQLTYILWPSIVLVKARSPLCLDDYVLLWCIFAFFVVLEELRSR